MILMIFLLMFVPVDSQPENCTYLMTVPKVTRPGTEIDICITMWTKGSGNVSIAAALRNNNGKTISGISKTYAGISGKLYMLKLKVPSDAPSGNDYHLDTICTGWVVFSKTIGNIKVDSRNASMFIQTDKPVYKPGDLGYPSSQKINSFLSSSIV